MSEEDTPQGTTDAIAERDDVEIILAAVRSLERLPQSLETLGSTRYCHDA